MCTILSRREKTNGNIGRANESPAGKGAARNSEVDVDVSEGRSPHACGTWLRGRRKHRPRSAGSCRSAGLEEVLLPPSKKAPRPSRQRGVGRRRSSGGPGLTSNAATGIQAVRLPRGQIEDRDPIFRGCRRVVFRHATAARPPNDICRRSSTFSGGPNDFRRSRRNLDPE